MKKDKITGHLWEEWDRRVDEKVHIKNFESSYCGSKTYCGKSAWSDFGNPNGAVDWIYPKSPQDLLMVTCRACKNRYKKRFANVEDLSFKTFKNKDFRGVDFRATSIIGCKFINCNLDGARANSIYLTDSGTDPYKVVYEKGEEGFILKYTGIWPCGRESPSRGNNLGHCLGLRGD